MTPSIAESIAIGLSIALCAASFVMARQSRAYRIQAEAAADRAEAAAETSRALRMVQDLEDTRRSYLAAHDLAQPVDVVVNAGGDATVLGAQISRAVRRARRRNDS